MSPEPLTKGPYPPDVHRASAAEPNLLSSEQSRQVPREDFGRHLVRARQGNEASQSARSMRENSCKQEKSGEHCSDKNAAAASDCVDAAPGEQPSAPGDQTSKAGDETKDENTRDLPPTPVTPNNSAAPVPVGASKSSEGDSGPDSSAGASAGIAGTALEAADLKGAIRTAVGTAKVLRPDEGGCAPASEDAKLGSSFVRPDDSLKTSGVQTASSRNADSALPDPKALANLETELFSLVAKEPSLLSAADTSLSASSLNLNPALATSGGAVNSATFDAGNTKSASLLSFYCGYDVTANSNPKAFGAALAPHLGTMISHSIDQAQIRMNPPELGPIRIELSLRDHDASITLTAAHPLTLSAIEQTAPSLRALLLEQGFTINRLEINEQQTLGEGTGRSGNADWAGNPDFSRNPDSSRNSNTSARTPWDTERESDRNRNNLLQVLDGPQASSRTQGLLDIFA